MCERLRQLTAVARGCASQEGIASALPVIYCRLRAEGGWLTMAETICVLGLGYVGLPTACMFAVQGHRVVGVDVKREVVETVARGEIHIDEAGLKTMLQAAINSRNLVARTEVEPADVFIIAVPTPLTPDTRAEGPALSEIRIVAQLARGFHTGVGSRMAPLYCRMSGRRHPRRAYST